ncbi:MAG: helix-turn-helix domain-containing protein [Terriglobia bacterium]
MQLRLVRRARGWSQKQAAARLGLSQSYFSMLESGKRRLTPRLARRLRVVFSLPPTFVPLPDGHPTAQVTEAARPLAEELAALGYPGFAYLSHKRPVRNPAEVLLAALRQDELEARVLEALPWLLVKHWDMDRHWLVQNAKLCDLQNRLGFVGSLARRVSERTHPPNNSRLRALAELEAVLLHSRLAREDVLGKRSLTARERQWLRRHRPATARRWNLLTDLRVEHLPYAD